jgi:hypothetical protein
MMNNEEIGDVLATSHAEPGFSSRMDIHELVEVIKLILHNPIVRSIATPQLSISGLLFLQPDGSITFHSTGW